MTDSPLLNRFRHTIAELRTGSRWGSAHVYQSTYNMFTLFLRLECPDFEHLSPLLLKHFEGFLRRRGCRWNTVSTYMRMLRAVYHRALDAGEAVYVPRLFAHVHTSVGRECKKALPPADMARLLRAGTGGDESNPGLSGRERRSCTLFCLMFLLRGIPFVDLAYLRKTDIRNSVLRYRRRKTHQPLIVSLPAEAGALLAALARDTPSSPYLLPFLDSPEDTEAAYREYQSALRRVNSDLATLASRLGIDARLSTYTARHTWATAAYHCGVHPGIISEAMGHSSITVTETYLKPFQYERIDRANRQVIDFVRQSSTVAPCGV